MKKERSLIYLGFLLLLVFVGISVFTFYQSNKYIEKGYLDSEGSAAENFAVLTASNIHLTDEEVETLKSYSYEEMQHSVENEALYNMMDNDSFASKVDYAYVMVHLDPNEVKYKVTEENKDRFNAKIGTNLDIMWLLDVNVDPENQNEEDHQDELERYSYYIKEDAVILGEAPSYTFNASEWGDHICGYSPLYSEEGTYIGAVGVELRTHDYNQYRNGAMWAMGILLLVSTFTLLALFIFLYFKYKKLQYDKIYTDSLTALYNRSYYNNQFIKRMNNSRENEPFFALMIADIDFFKKVNDTFGHEVGDEVLMEMGLLLTEVFGRTCVIRFGGEEFVIGLWVDNTELIRKQLDFLFEKIAGRKFSKQQIDISISLGCSYYETDDLTGWLTSGMLKAADYNLYEVKENGRKDYRIVRYNENEKYQKK